MSFKVGDRLIFKGYAEDIQEEYKVLEPGDLVEVAELSDDGTTPLVRKIGGEDDVLITVFPEEVEPAPQDADASHTTKGNTKSGKLKKKQSEEGSESVQEERTEVSAPAQRTEPVPVARSFDETDVPQTESVREALRESADALEAAKKLVERGEHTDFTLGGVLYLIHQNGLHKAQGFDGKRGFEEFVRKELGIEYRKAMYLISIYKTFVSLGLDERKIAEIGWSKAKELRRVLAIAGPDRLREDFDRIVDYARNHNREELIEYINSEYEKVEVEQAKVEEVKKVTFKIVLTDQQAAVVQQALALAKERIGAESLGAALESICVDWQQLTVGVEKDLDATLREVEAKFGVRLQVLNAADEAVDTEELDSEELAQVT